MVPTVERRKRHKERAHVSCTESRRARRVFFCLGFSALTFDRSAGVQRGKWATSKQTLVLWLFILYGVLPKPNTIQSKHSPITTENIFSTMKRLLSIATTKKRILVNMRNTVPVFVGKGVPVLTRTTMTSPKIRQIMHNILIHQRILLWLKSFFICAPYFILSLHLPRPQ